MDFELYHTQNAESKTKRVNHKVENGKLHKVKSTRTQISVWLVWESLSGIQFERSSIICQLDNVVSKSISGIWGKDGKQVVISVCNLWKSAFLRTSEKFCSRGRSTTFGIFMAV